MKQWIVGIVFSLSAGLAAGQDQSTLKINPPDADLSMVTAPADATSKTSFGEILKNKQFQENLQITDPKLRAEEGSLSRYSLKFNLTYDGPMIGDLSAEDRPNPDNNVAPTATSLNGSMMLRYRLSTQSAMNFGTGVNGRYPTEGFDQFDLRTPLASYDVFSVTKELQIKNSFGMTVTTVPEYRQVGQIGGLNTDFAIVHNIGKSRFAIGLDSRLSYSIYSRKYIDGPGLAAVKKQQHHHHNSGQANATPAVIGDGNASQYDFIIFPSIKYLMTDHFDMSTSLSFCMWNPRANSNIFDDRSKTLTQRLALNYAFTRDIYISPYIGFYPTEFGWDTTTINISAIVSLL